MAAVDRGSSGAAPEPPPTNAARSVEAERLLDMFTAAKPIKPDAFVPEVGMPGGGDIQLQPGLYTYALIGPEVWPTDSESQLSELEDELARLADHHESASASADAQVGTVLGEYWTAGDGAAAAEEHYAAERAAHQQLAEACRYIGRGYGRLGGYVRSIKRKIREAHDEAHRKIEEALRANKGLPVTVDIAPILAEYRGLIEGHSAELRTFVADETVMLGNEFKLAPPGQDDGQDPGRGQPSDDGAKPAEGSDGTDPTSSEPGRGQRADTGRGSLPGHAGDGAGLGGDGAGLGTVIGRGQPPDMPISPPSNGRPSMPQVPSLPSTGGGGSSPLSGAASGGMGPLSGLLGGGSPASSSSASGLAGSAGSAANPAAMQQFSARAMSSAVGGELGRSFAAGAANAAGGVPVTPAQPIPQTPSTPLGVPPAGAGTTSVSAAPASASMGPGPLAAPASGSSMGAPASATGVPGGGAAAPMTPYGSVLPPAPPASGAAAGGPSPASFSSPAPPVTGGAAGGPPPSFIPAVRDSAPARVGRDLSMNDLESARMVVADLAAASSAVYPGLQWAVLVARGASGMPEMWVTTNEGAGYIPHGVFVSRSMPLAAGLDPAFDARWFGWSNPAETVLRAVQARGDAVSAIATTWPQESEEVRAASEDVAIGVAPLGGPAEAEASTLTRGRSHRLETVDPALYHELSLADQHEVDAYVRQLTQQAAFNTGPELSLTAQSVARALVAGRWPEEAEWNALRTEYDSVRLMAGSQHPGLLGFEEPAQLLTYQTDFALCRRIETLLCWDDGAPADVAYAARAAGVIAAFTASV